ncbi:beta-1,3-galactosyltransferase 4-like [Convolutriloba macropyga]|uniref:beta-1,3-galactosyltransferase 4-like n=1 Tax=Convolutriloba macropyga TaxID=536237 RepID=UPI003F525148
MIFTRVGDFAKRNTVRQTYFQDIRNNSKSLNYVTFFALAIPAESVRARVEREQLMHKDLAILNNEEGYALTTYKLLTGMKFATCCCPNAKYFMKADVDAYLRIKKVDSYLNELQQIADGEKPRNKIDAFYGKSWESHVPLYSGGICAIMIPQRKPNPHAISVEALPDKKFPFKFCFGHLEIYSMTLIKLIVQYCPRHCYGDYNHSIPMNVSRPCESQWEDIFMGSCVYSYFRNDVYVESIHRISKQDATYAPPSIEKLKMSSSEHLDRYVMAAQVSSQGLFRKLHTFFQTLDNGVLRNQTENSTIFMAKLDKLT